MNSVFNSASLSIYALSTKTFGILGYNMSLNCTAYSISRLTATWRKNNEHISSSSSDILLLIPSSNLY